MFKVSHSRIKTWRKCHRQYFYKYVMNLRRKLKGRPLMFGSIVHEALELALAGKPTKPVFDRYAKELKKFFREELVEMGIENVLPEAQEMVELYQWYYDKDKLKYLAVELDFLVEVEDGIWYEGKIDAVVEDQDGWLWILERKTAKNIPEEKVRNTDVQSVVYRSVFPHLRIKQGRKLVSFDLKKLRGIIWDYVRSKVPSRPKLLKDQKSLSKARIDTLREIYIEEIERHGFDVEDYEDILKSLEGSDIDFFRRVRLPFSNHLVQEVMADFHETAVDIRETGTTRRDRNLGRDCMFCEFYNLCQAELRGSDTALMLKTDYEDHKNAQEVNENLQ